MTPSSKLSYLGGLFDGEGNAGVVSIQRKFYPDAKKKMRAPSRVPYLQLKMTDEAPILLLKETFGGSCSSYQKPERKRVYTWRVSHRQALTAAQQLFQYCIVKIPQLQLVLEHYRAI